MRCTISWNDQACELRDKKKSNFLFSVTSKDGRICEFFRASNKIYCFFIVINEEIERVQPLSPPCIIPFFHFFQWQEICSKTQKSKFCIMCTYFLSLYLGLFNMFELKQRKEWIDQNQRHSQKNLIWNPSFYSKAEYRIPAIFSSYRKPKAPGFPFKIQHWEDKGPLKLAKSILFGKVDNRLR